MTHLLPVAVAAALLDDVSDAVVVLGPAGERRYANPAAQALGEDGQSPAWQRLAARARSQRGPAEAHDGGHWRRATPLPDGGVKLVARPLAGTASAALFDAAPADMLVLALDGDGTVSIERCNPAFCQTTGLDAARITGQAVSAALHPSAADILTRHARICATQQSGFESQHSFHFPIGERLLRTRYRPLPHQPDGLRRVLYIQEDLTESHRLEVALHQALRLEVVGQLTGGVAHDFNNLLTAILGSLELLGRAATQEREQRWIKVATDAAQRGATLTQQLLAYARKQFLDPAPTDIPAAIGGMTELLRGSLGSRITLRTQFALDTWLAHTDVAQLELALLNLVVNARAAMPSGGRLTLSTRNVQPGADALPPELDPADYVVLAVEDTGQGMPPDVLARALEPFFTTKGIGEGSGLGLSEAYGFARQLGGTLRLTSAPGAGTLVEIYLPRARTGRAE